MVEVRTKFDENVIKEINKAQFKKVLWFGVILSVIMLGLGALLIILNTDDSLVVGVIAIVFGFLFTPLLIWLMKINQNKVIKTMSIMGNETFETYKFDEEKIFIETKKGEIFKGTTEADYSYFYMVKESETNWFLYINAAQMHVVPKNRIIEGSVEELNDLFVRKLGIKFYPLKK